MHQIVSLIFLMIIFEVTEHGTNLWHVCKAVFLRKEKRSDKPPGSMVYVKTASLVILSRPDIPFPAGTPYPSEQCIHKKNNCVQNFFRLDLSMRSRMCVRIFLHAKTENSAHDNLDDLSKVMMNILLHIYTICFLSTKFLNCI
jgi:hypothetical protein